MAKYISIEISYDNLQHRRGLFTTALVNEGAKSGIFITNRLIEDEVVKGMAMVSDVIVLTEKYRYKPIAEIISKISNSAGLELVSVSKTLTQRANAVYTIYFKVGSSE